MRIILQAGALAALLASGGALAQTTANRAADAGMFPQMAHGTDMGMDMDEAMATMSTMNPAMAAHMTLTSARTASDADRQRASQLLETLRNWLGKYKDYRVAEQDGFRPIVPERALPIYHFTNARFEKLANSSFDASKPTSLLYRKAPGGYELMGVMYTASPFATEDELNARVPLGIARWHRHTNICLPRMAQYESADWSRFGFDGSIVGEQACRQAGGLFYNHVFGWMVHIFPFENSPEKIWAH